ncbi:MAG: hypothetical protein ACKO96_07830, partial [Flammeovirgaceae bacterium]
MVKYAQAQADRDEKARIRAEKLAQAEAKKVDAYVRVNSWLKKLSDEHKNLAVRQELGGKLTAAEIKRMQTLEGRIQRYDAALKKVDVTQGKHQRFVGEYTRGWNGLGNSVQQLSRELPAFGNSIQTGFMAISNNLPIFFDEIKKVRLENQALAASGQPTVSAFKQIAQSVFSLTGLLGLGVTALTVFGSKIADVITETIWGHQKTKEEIEKERVEKEKAIQTQKELNKKRREGSEFVGRESSELVSLLVGLKQTNKGSKERAELMTIINDKYGLHLKNLKDEGKFQEMV